MNAMKLLGALLILGTAACVATPSEPEPTQQKEQEEKAGEVESKDEAAPSCFCFGCTKYCESNGEKTQGTCC